MPFQYKSTQGNALRTDQEAVGTNPIDNITLAQALTYLENNVSTLATAKVYLKELTKKVFIQERRIARLEAIVKKYQEGK